MPPDPYIRWTDPDDLGNRPPGSYLYAMPSLSIVKPPGFDPDPAIAFADIDDQFVHVEVSNRGTDDADATVTVWAAGFGTASGYAGSLGGTDGVSVGLIVPAGSTGNTTSVNIPWKPQPPEIGGAERHFCIRANVFVDPNDQEPPPGSPPGTPPTISIHTNIRHGQRNMTLLPKPTTLRDPISFAFAVANLDEENDEEFRFDVREVRGELEPNEIAHLRQTRWIDRESGERLILTGGQGEGPVRAARRPARELAIAFEGKSGEELTTRLKAGQQDTMELHMALDPGDDAVVHRFDVSQHGRDGLVGSARVMTLAVPEALLVYDTRPQTY